MIDDLVAAQDKFLNALNHNHRDVMAGPSQRARQLYAKTMNEARGRQEKHEGSMRSRESVGRKSYELLSERPLAHYHVTGLMYAGPNGPGRRGLGHKRRDRTREGHDEHLKHQSYA